MTKISQTEEELKIKLQEQLNLLSMLADNYDRGQPIAARSMATSIRVLVHDTNNSHSLLGLLGLKTKKFFDTARPHPVSIGSFQVGSFYGLIGIDLGARQIFIPHLDDVSADIFGNVDFNGWWNRIIFVDQKNNTFSRKEIVLAVTNQDGGAHIDPQIDEKYRQLSRENSLGLVTSPDGRVWNDAQGSELAAIRQIGHEILRSFYPNYPYRKSIATGSGWIIGDFSMKVEPAKKGANAMIQQPQIPKVGRNEKCPCGSGLKYKKCHGK